LLLLPVEDMQNPPADTPGRERMHSTFSRTAKIALAE
jgi:hypothetical protein